MNIYFDAEVNQNFLKEKIEELNPSSIFVLTDHNTEDLCLPELRSKYLKEVPFQHLSIPAGEKEKNIHTCTDLWKKMTDLHADRNSLLINLGGGVITDLGGFLASLYKRGCHFINVPTSLLGMVDAAIGGKTGVDLEHLKNIIGIIQNPAFTYINRNFLTTLSKEELESGWAELIKHALIHDPKLWNKIKTENDLSIPDVETLKKGVLVKEEIVLKDPREKGIRKNLNYGHTVGHAIESFMLSNRQPTRHGYAVITGIVIENIISSELGLMKETIKNEINDFLTNHYTLINGFDSKQVYENMLHDKKNVGKEIRLSLIEDIGKPVFDVQCDQKVIKAAFQTYSKLIQA